MSALDKIGRTLYFSVLLKPGACDLQCNKCKKSVCTGRTKKAHGRQKCWHAPVATETFTGDREQVNHAYHSVKTSLNQFFTKNFFDLAWKYTNETIIRKNSSRKQTIKPVTHQEIRKYLAVLLYLGIIPVKNVRSIWDKRCKWCIMSIQQH